VERVYQMLLAVGYPPEGIDWIRKHRLPVIAAMAVAAWAFFIALGWLVWVVLT
jgi:hypothetical protein